MKKSLDITLIYVLDIFSLLCCCFGIGSLLSIPAYLIANKKIKAVQINPDEYEGGLNQLKTAKTVSLVLVIINLIFFLFVLFFFIIPFINIYNDPDSWMEFQKEFEKAMGEMNQSA